MRHIETTGRTLEEAKISALKALSATSSEVEVEVLDSGAKGFLGIGFRPVKIRVSKILSPVDNAKAFLQDIFDAMQINVQMTCTQGEKDLTIELKGDNIGALIGKRGQTLDSLQYLVNLVVKRGDPPFPNIILDAENYRARRKETLEVLALNLAKKAKMTRKPVVLEPMSSYERKIIHAALQNNKFVSTKSEGQDPHRYIVITPK